MDNMHLYTKIAALPDDLKKEALDFVEFLRLKNSNETVKKQRAPGMAKGLIEIRDDFDAPLEDFNEYQY